MYDCLVKEFNIDTSNHNAFIKEMQESLQNSDADNLFNILLSNKSVANTMQNNIKTANCYFQSIFDLHIDDKCCSVEVCEAMYENIKTKFHLIPINGNHLLDKLKWALWHIDSSLLFSMLLSDYVPVKVENNAIIFTTYLRTVNAY